ncbi:MAG TPA: hypothetical protein VFS34_12325, partial [Thermoanaerobaculia bacterium]|nr:hypothetical protein [Thermoanaerobaculia bacterium]
MTRIVGVFFAATLVAGSFARVSHAETSARAPAGCPAFPAGVVEYLKTLPVDPHVLHEQRRRARRDMIEESLYDVCLHRQWLVLHGISPSSAAEPSPAAAAGESGSLLAPMAATVGTNVAPPTVLPPIGNGGLADYQGETAISVDPNDPLRMAGH